MKLFISPHNDDETLFGAFTILRETPAVLIVTSSARQESKGITAWQRVLETFQAFKILQPCFESPPEEPLENAALQDKLWGRVVLRSRPFFLGIPDASLNRPELEKKLRAFISREGPFDHIYAPAYEELGNADHNLIAGIEFDVPTTRYLTYTAHGKSRSEKIVPFEPEWPLLKLQALSCYRSQILEPSTRDHFLRDQYEYYA